MSQLALKVWHTINFGRPKGWFRNRSNPRRHKLTSEECELLKAVIRRRLMTEDYTCRMVPDFPRPKVRAYRWDYKPIVRYRLRTVVVGGLTNRHSVWK